MGQEAIEKIRNRMKDMNMGVKELAEKSVVGTSFVYDILSGKSKNPTMQKLYSISKVLNISIAELIDCGGENSYKEFTPIFHLNQDKENSLPKLMINNTALTSISMPKNLFFYNINSDFSNSLKENDTVIVDSGKKSGGGIFLVKNGFNFEVRKFDNNNSSNEANDNSNNITIIGKIFCFFRCV